MSEIQSASTLANYPECLDGAIVCDDEGGQVGKVIGVPNGDLRFRTINGSVFRQPLPKPDESAVIDGKIYVRQAGPMAIWIESVGGHE